MSEPDTTAPRPVPPLVALAHKILGETRQEAIDAVYKAADKAASGNQCTTMEVLAASAFLLASALVDEDPEMQGPLHGAHSVMVGAAIEKLRRDAEQRLQQEPAGHA